MKESLLLNGEQTVQKEVSEALKEGDIVILPPQDVFDTLSSINTHVTATLLDPWYNKGVGGQREDYIPWLNSVIAETSKVSDHILVWGFPEIVYKVLDTLPEGTELVAWLTWYYKNCPTVIRGWRSAQLTCLHIAKFFAKLYPEHFMNEVQLEKYHSNKLRYIPGPPTVIESALLIGFVGRNEQIGNPSKTAQKPAKVIEPLIKMTTIEGDLVLDPMCGTGTTGEVCRKLGRRAILCDQNEERIKMVEDRLGIERLKS
ncbi:MAG: site-specific DNA-methyltransferase [Halobacteriota archaeon]